MSTILEIIKEKAVTFVDLRFTDTRGKEQHITVPSKAIDKTFLEKGKMFDGSSIQGWTGVQHSELIMRPDLQVAPILDPFYEKPTLILRCDIIDPLTMKGYIRDPRSVAKRAEAYLKETGIADGCFFGPEPEFFIFDSVRWKASTNEAFYLVDSKEGIWNSGTEFAHGNMGHRPGLKGGYFPVPPRDSLQDMRSTMCDLLDKAGIFIEVHHHEVGTAGQSEISMLFQSLLNMSDCVQVFKYIVQNTAHSFGKTATFMPKPLVGENGSGMHCHQSLSKNGQNLFAGDKYAGLSDIALYYIGGIIKHARALNAFTNPGTNSYKRLVPGFEAPVMLAYSAGNRSAAIRIPFASTAKESRIEVRFPDATANPYLAFSAMMMAGLDGIQNKIHPGDPMEVDLYELSEGEARNIPKVCCSLEEAIRALDEDCEFLLKGDVFSRDLIDSYVVLKEMEVTRLRATTHPVEFDMYYSL
jgi:glutamine synthetase